MISKPLCECRTFLDGLFCSEVANQGGTALDYSGSTRGGRNRPRIFQKCMSYAATLTVVTIFQGTNDLAAVEAVAGNEGRGFVEQPAQCFGDVTSVRARISIRIVLGISISRN